MIYGRVSGLANPVSKLVMGAPSAATVEESRAVFDGYLERGGNCFDTAFIYHEGQSERVLGEWIADRGVRHEVLILGKGAHTPNCDPISVERELSVSLDRLQTEYVDLYMLHRDNADVPVGEFVEVLNKELQSGRVRALGVSNWTRERFDAANGYASERSLAGVVALSNHFSLAELGEPTFEGCLDCMSPAWLEWLKVRQVPNFSWSSQAGGLFVDGRVIPDRGSWSVPENENYRQRARELGQTRGVPARAIALAYVLAQPFPSFAIIGSRGVPQVIGAIEAIDVHLSDAEVRWLRNGSQDEVEHGRPGA